MYYKPEHQHKVGIRGLFVRILYRLNILSLRTDTFEEYLRYAFSSDIYKDAPIIVLLPYEPEILYKLKKDLSNARLLEESYNNMFMKNEETIILRENLSRIYQDIYTRDLTVGKALIRLSNLKKNFYIVE